jgi:large subunit ribosomal protein L9
MSMKVILQKDVPRIGRKHDVKDVPDGHAQNFLLPRGLAVRATEDALTRLTLQKTQHHEKQVQSEMSFTQALTDARGKQILVASDSNDEGNLYRAINARDIIESLTTHGIILDEASIKIDTPIKSLGEHTVSLSSQGNKGHLTITVVAKK